MQGLIQGGSKGHAPLRQQYFLLQTIMLRNFSHEENDKSDAPLLLPPKSSYGSAIPMHIVF